MQFVLKKIEPAQVSTYWWKYSILTLYEPAIWYLTVILFDLKKVRRLYPEVYPESSAIAIDFAGELAGNRPECKSSEVISRW